MSNNDRHFAARDPKSFVETVGVLVLALSILEGLRDAVFVWMGTWFGGEVTVAGVSVGDKAIRPFSRWLVDHLSLAYFPKFLLSMACVVASLGLLNSKPWSLRVFRFCLPTLAVVQVWLLGWALAGSLVYLPAQWNVATFGFEPPWTYALAGMQVLWHGAMAAVYTWLFVGFGRREVRAFLNVEQETRRDRLSVAEWIVGACSFIPGLGVLLALVSVILGAIRYKVGGWKILILGLGGIVFNVALFAAAFHVAFSGKLGPGAPFAILARQHLVGVVKSLEYYKQAHGKYPEALEELTAGKRPEVQQGLMIFDTSAGVNFKGRLPYFQYGLLDGGRHYYLFGVGPDGQAGTADDVFPEIPQAETEHIGYRKKP